MTRQEHRLSLLADEYEQNHQQMDSAQATIDYNIMMGVLEDPEAEEDADDE